jgi:hypothetical protein
MIEECPQKPYSCKRGSAVGAGNNATGIRYLAKGIGYRYKSLPQSTNL